MSIKKQACGAEADRSREGKDRSGGAENPRRELGKVIKSVIVRRLIWNPGE